MPDRKPRTALIVGGIAAVVLAAVVAIVIAVFAGSKAPSDEQRIRSLVHHSFNAWKRGDADEYANTVCAAQRQSERESVAHDSNRDDGDLTVGKVTIDGDHAEAEVTVTKHGESDTNTLHVVREDGEWKLCN